MVISEVEDGLLASTPFSRWNKRPYACACAYVATENQALGNLSNDNGESNDIVTNLYI